MKEYFGTSVSKSLTPLEIKKVIKEAYGKFEELKSKAEAVPDNKCACTEGCSYCCNLIVSARSYEMIQILDHIDTNLSGIEKSEVLKQAEENVKKMQRFFKFLPNVNFLFTLNQTNHVFI